MSYLTTPDLPEFSKAVISFWFKVSQEAMDAAQQESDDWWAAHQDDDDPDVPPLLGLVPLLVFGKEGTSPKHPQEHNSIQDHTETHSYHSCATDNPVYDNSYPTAMVSWGVDCYDGSYDTHWSSTTVSYTTTGGKPTEPSYIAIDGSGRLQIHFESTKIADYHGYCGLLSAEGEHVTSGHGDICFYYPITDGCSAGSQSYTDSIGGLCGILLWVVAIIGFHLLTAVADNVSFGAGSGNEHVDGTWNVGEIPGDMGSGAISVSLPTSGNDAPFAGDVWHHVLISVDMTGGGVSSGGTISSSSTLYAAVDDKNYDTASYPLTGNQVVPSGCATGPGGGNPDCPTPSYSLTGMTVPSAPLGIPCVGKYTDKIRKVQMAELLFFTGQTLDTSVEENRRHFITAPGASGYQHPTNFEPIYIPMRKFAFGDPAEWEPGADNPAFAPPLFDPSLWPTGIRGLGNADVDFTKCQWNWQMGLNLGKLQGKCTKTGQMRGLVPPKDESPRIKAGG